MAIEGELIIDLVLDKPSNRITIQSTRPVYACQMLHGKSVSESLNLLPLLFNICGVAQACAGVRACEQALDLKVSKKTEKLRDVLVKLETLREHLWRIILEWPRFIQKVTQTAQDNTGIVEMLLIQRDYQKALCANSQHRSVLDLGGVEVHSDQAQLKAVLKRFANLLKQHVFTITASEWLTLKKQKDLQHWAASKTSIAAQLIQQIIEDNWYNAGACQSVTLPALDLIQLDQAMQDVQYVRQPQWQGQCCETSSLTRAQSPLLMALKKDHGNGLLVRLVARLTETAQLFQELTDLELENEKSRISDETALQTAITEKKGIGQAAAARGLLVHRVSINNNLIEYYQILAPTEWNFHPQGVVAQALASLQGDPQTIEKKARLLINSIDPCVAYKLQITG